MASNVVFGDASFFFALAARRDPAHEEAVKALGVLVKRDRRILTTDYVLDEALTLTKARTNPVVALALLDRIERSAAIELEMVGVSRFELAKAFFRKHADHGYSFTDCTSFVLVRELEIEEALTTDRHFTEAGFRTLLPTG